MNFISQWHIPVIGLSGNIFQLIEGYIISKKIYGNFMKSKIESFNFYINKSDLNIFGYSIFPKRLH